TSRLSKSKPKRLPHSAIEALETFDSLAHLVTNSIVVASIVVPWRVGVGKRGFGNSCDDGALGTHIGRAGLFHALGRMNHTNRILHRDPLYSGFTPISFRSAKAGQD